MDTELYKKLNDLRESLRKIPDEQGRLPRVCSDAALLELARLAPKAKEELLLVNGLGKAFVEKFGDSFMAVLGEYHAAHRSKMSVLTGDVKTVLTNLENRLININRRNRLLYMPKLPANTFDLCSVGLDNVRLADFILRPGGKARMTINKPTDGEEAEQQYKRFLRLERETARDARESGESSLFIAYPFVTGCTGVEQFDVRAPLALFPVELIVNPDSVVLKIDESKDVLLNTNLILTHYKFNGITAQLPDNDIDRGSDFMERLIGFFEAVGIHISTPKKKGLAPFVEYKAGKFPKHRTGEFVLEESVVLGRFSLCSSAIQRDFKEIIAGGKINPLLNDLLEDVADVDIYSDSEDAGETPDNSIPRERELNYINDLNISQENAIRNINNGDRLVMQGPPGTGKSQTITSMIADFVNKGRNVLMVSQKKAALDVIYSRLGRQSRYAMLVNDVRDKDSFYEQLYKIFSTGEAPVYSGATFEETSAAIDRGLAQLDDIADRLYYDAPAGAPMYRIYEENRNNSFKRESGGVIDLYAAYVDRQLLAAGYTELKELKHDFADAVQLDMLKQFKDLDAQYSWLGQLKSSTLSAIEIKSILGDVNEIIDQYAKVYSMNPIRRAFHKGSIRKPIKKLLKSCMARPSKKLIKYFATEPTDLYNGFEQYERYYTLKAKADALSDLQRCYFDSLYRLAHATDVALAELNKRVFDYCVFCCISQFEATNRDILAALGNFDSIVRAVTESLDRKKDLTRERFRATLVDAYKNNIEESKRNGEMQRVIDGKRRMSIARFISKFQFELFKGIKVWLMTPEVVSEVLPLENDLFDLLIFDEASQIYIERGVPSIARARKVVIAGDNKQLRPSSLGDGRIGYSDEYTDEDVTAALEEESLLDLARFKYPEIMLNYHYRSRYEELIAFSNHAFYKGRLNISPNVDAPDAPPIEVIYTPDGIWEDRCNRAEAGKVIELLKKFFATRKNSETIGVITFNASQRDLICDLLDEECRKNADFAEQYNREFMRKENGEDIGLFIKNIENVQGDERDHIIFSLAYAKNETGKVVRNFGWLNQEGGENRLNVAISRAKRKIQIVTSIHYTDLKVDDLKNEGPRIFRKYLEYAEAVSDGDRDRAKTVLDSFGATVSRTYSVENAFVFEVFTELATRGFHVERNVGMGAYKIDIAILDAQGNYKMGIECDANLYGRSRAARERDVQLRRYLTGRGWKLYRLWSSSWWRNTDEEIRRIKQAAGL